MLHKQTERPRAEIVWDICDRLGKDREIAPMIEQAIDTLEKDAAELAPILRWRDIVEAARAADAAAKRLQTALCSLSRNSLLVRLPSFHVVGHGWVFHATEMDLALIGIERLRHSLGWLGQRGRDGKWMRRPGPGPDRRFGLKQYFCARAAFALAHEHGTRRTSRRAIASLLFEAIAGADNVDLKQACELVRKEEGRTDLA